MTLEEEIKQIEAELKERGVQDVKFTWAPDVHLRSREEILTAVRDGLRAYLNGEGTSVDLEAEDL